MSNFSEGLVDRVLLQPRVVGDWHPAQSVPCVAGTGPWIAGEVLADLP